MKISLRTKLDQLSARLQELDALLAAEDATRDLDRYRALARERAEIDPVVARFGEFEHAEADLAAAVEMAHGDAEPLDRIDPPFNGLDGGHAPIVS